MDAVWWSLALIGAGVAYSGATGQSPVGELRAALTGDGRPSRRVPLLSSGGAVGAIAGENIGSSSAAPGAAAAGGPGLSASPGAGAPDDLTQLYRLDGSPYGGHRLRKAAADAYQAAQVRLGRDIPITSGYRDIVGERARNIANPRRFPVPNYHTAGQAIDVHDGAYSGGGWSGTNPATDPALIAALESVGWQRFDPSNARGERMHWSIGGRG